MGNGKKERARAKGEPLGKAREMDNDGLEERAHRDREILVGRRLDELDDVVAHARERAAAVFVDLPAQ